MPDYRRRAVRESMSVRVDVNGMMAEAIADRGVSRDEVDALAGEAGDAARTLQARRAAGELPFLDLSQQQQVLKQITTLAAAVREQLDTLVVLDVGGSAPGIRALLDALGAGGMRVLLADNIDPWTFGHLLDEIDLTRSAFNVVSRSGETAETLAQFLIVRDLLLRTLGAIDYKDHIIVTTDGEAGELRQIVNDEGFRDLIAPPGASGRFSILNAVSLFPAAAAGIRIADLLAGAVWMDARTQSPAVWENPALLLATLLYLAATRRERNVVVFMPYCDRLHSLAAWFTQLWAESLGKKQDLIGRQVRSGQTPMAARGATDQHAMLQLLLDGPHDKVVILLRVEDHEREIAIPAGYGDLDGVGYLGGHGLGELLNDEQRATELALQKQQRMVITLTLPQLNAFTMGQLCYLFATAALLAGTLHGVNPLDQPAIEEGKRLTYGLAGRKGCQEQAAEVEAWLAGKRTQYIL